MSAASSSGRGAIVSSLSSSGMDGYRSCGPGCWGSVMPDRTTPTGAIARRWHRWHPVAESSGAVSRAGLAVAAAFDDQQDDQDDLGELVEDADGVVLALDEDEVGDDRRGGEGDQGPAGESTEPGERGVVEGGGEHDVAETVEVEQRGEEAER